MAHVFLAGMMGSGKSTIAQLLSDRLHVPCYDLDQMVAQRMHMSIPEIFRLFGNRVFHEKEAATLRENLINPDGIWALGGGTLTTPGIPELLREHGLLLFLYVPLETLANRVTGDSSRPLLHDCSTQEERVQRLTELYEERKATYRLCEVEIRFDGSESLDTTANMVLQELELYRSCILSNRLTK